eukprot:m51a1_g5870 hypothetical protein (392) ;mRNA; f:407723-413536
MKMSHDLLTIFTAKPSEKRAHQPFTFEEVRAGFKAMQMLLGGTLSDLIMRVLLLVSVTVAVSLVVLVQRSRTQPSADTASPPLPPCPRSLRSRRALATLVTSPSYVAGAVVLARSYNATADDDDDGNDRNGPGDNATTDLVALVGDNVTEAQEAVLRSAGWRAVRVRTIERALGGPEQRYVASTYTKAHLWSLTAYASLLYVDSDCVLLRGVARAACVAEGSGGAAVWSTKLHARRWNSGVMALAPSAATHAQLLAFLQSGRWEHAVGGDQDVLNAFFSSGGRRRLPLGRDHNVGIEQPGQRPFDDGAAVLHYLGARKPWDDTEVACVLEGGSDSGSGSGSSAVAVVPRERAASECDAEATMRAAREANDYNMYWWGLAVDAQRRLSTPLF